MNYLYIALCLVAAIVVIDAYPQKCDTSEDCLEKRCCVNVDGGWSKLAFCKSLRGEGKECIPQGPENGKYMYECPCQEHLECVGEPKTKSSNSDESSSSSESDELEYRCRAPATSPAPESEEKTEEPGPEQPEEPEPEQQITEEEKQE